MKPRIKAFFDYLYEHPLEAFYATGIVGIVAAFLQLLILVHVDTILWPPAARPVNPSGYEVLFCGFFTILALFNSVMLVVKFGGKAGLG